MATIAVLLIGLAVSGAAGQEQNPQLSDTIFKNVRVLKGIPVDEFMDAMGMFASSLGYDCSSCHSPHGSTNPRLLKVSVVNMLCLQCHTFPTIGPIGPAHNQSAKYQACTMCHAQIHGSNFSSVFFK